MITAQLATIPGRERSVKDTIESIVSQVDNLIVISNSYSDANKFSDLPREGYIFTCDDDLIYSPDYVQTMIDKIEEYGRKCLITCHGRTFRKDRPVKSYYRDKLQGFRCLGNVEKDVYVDSGGTGVMAWHSDLWRPEMDWFKAPNMADVFIGREARRRGIKIVCIAHREGWIQSTPEGHDGIWNKHVNDDRLQTDYWNEII